MIDPTYLAIQQPTKFEIKEMKLQEQYDQLGISCCCCFWPLRTKPLKRNLFKKY
jgi:hypothetical protein